MRVILTALGSKGDVFPFLGLGQALTRRGHEVKVISSGEYENFIRDAGLEYVELFDRDFHIRINDVLERMGKHWASKPRDPEDLKVLEAFFDYIPGGLCRKIEELHVPGDSVVATAELFTMGAAGLAWERCGIPYASLWHNSGMFRVVSPVMPRFLGWFERWLKNTVIQALWLTRAMVGNYKRTRQEFGLPAARNTIAKWWYTAQANIAFFPTWFIPWSKGRMRNTVIVGFPLWEPDTGGELDPALEAFLQEGEPPVVFSYASWQGDVDDYYDASAAACEALGLRGVLITQRAGGSARRRSAGVIEVEFAPFNLLLPRAAALVHHAGIGTTARALAEGVPQIVVPKYTDQPHNSRKLTTLGVAYKISPGRYGKEITPTLKKLLASPKIRANCKDMASRIDKNQDFRGAVLSLEKLLRTSQEQAKGDREPQRATV